MSPIDRYAYFNRLTEKNPFLKMAVGFVGLILALGLNSIPVQLGVLVVMGLLVVAVAGIPLRGYLGLYKIPGGFLLLSILTIAVSVSLGEEGFHIGPVALAVTEESLAMAGRLFFRALACIASTYFIALTVPMNQQVEVFKKMRLPKEFIEMTVLIYRFINIFMEEFRTMENAMELKLGTLNFRTALRSVSLLGSGIFFRVMDSYSDWKNVLEVKLYDGNFYF